MGLSPSQPMIEKEQSEIYLQIISAIKAILPYVTTFLLSTWGGTVAYIKRIRAAKIHFTWVDWGYDIIVSSFVGLLMHFLCQYSHVEGPIQSVLIAISAHAGARTLAKLEIWRDKLLNLPSDVEIKDDERL